MDNSYHEEKKVLDQNFGEPVRKYSGGQIVRVERTGRNAPCPCGSGLKYKKCCIGKRSVYGVLETSDR